MNNRKDGKKLCRRTSTKKCCHLEDRCKVSIGIKIDNELDRYYIGCGFGSNIHTGHPILSMQEISIPPNIVPGQIKELMLNIRTGNNSLNQIKMILSKDPYNCNLSRNQIAYICGHVYKEAQYKDLCEHAPLTFLQFSKKTEDPSKSILSYLRTSYQCSYVVLYHDNTDGTELPSYHCVYDTHSVDSYEKSVSCVFPQGMEHDISDNLDTYSLGGLNTGGTNKKTIIAIAWITDGDRRNFELYPEVWYSDVTFGTNNEKRPLFNVAGKDSFGKAFMGIKMFFMNQRLWMFTWEFQCVIPALLSSTIISCNRLILSDGDGQEIDAITRFIRTHAPQSFFRRCKFHIITQFLKALWKRYLRYNTVDENMCLHNYNELKDWIYSFFDEVESEEEFKISRHLLENWLTKQEDIVDSLGKDACQKVMNYLNNSLFPYSHHFCFYHYRTLLCFNASTTSPLEGLNNKIKMNGIGVKSNFSLPASARLLDSQGKARNDERGLVSASEIISTPTWCITSTSRDIISIAEGLLHAEYMSTNNYCYMATTRYKYRVLYVGPRAEMRERPFFVRIRDVVYVNGVMTCSCCLWNRLQICCRHIMVVTGGGHKDQAGIRWTKI